jgi:phospholipid/cholesterol/gamma-HCH transport system substrate-binding protein|tara:strand:+ start:8140 stop:9432 length:1293 start_codon:yes stop_codon:yes gene_type:complete
VITRRTKIQLLVFVVITLVGCSFVGARYAKLDRLFYDSAYTVTAHFGSSGGIFAGAEVTYRGVQIGKVDRLVLTEEGVDVELAIDNQHDSIPAATLALVGNKSAVGEQYVELQPKSNDEPYLADGSEIAMADTRTPIQVEQLLSNLATTVGSVDRKALKTTVTELGAAFAGTGEELQQIIDTGNDFINAANDNFDTTTALIRDGNTVLNGQIASESAIRSFARNLSLFTGALADADPEINTLLDNGSGAAVALRRFIDDNEVELGSLINNLITTGEIVTRRLDGLEQILVIYPYVVEGGFTVVSKSPDTGLYDAHFGLIITTNPICHDGYQSTDTRPPQNGENRPMNEEARCDEPPAVSNARGAQNIYDRFRAPADYDSEVVASYDPESETLTWGDRVPGSLTSPGSVAPRTLGKESWKWLFLQPLTSSR